MIQHQGTSNIGTIQSAVDGAMFGIGKALRPRSLLIAILLGVLLVVGALIHATDLDGGFTAWAAAAGLPVIRKSAPRRTTSGL